MNKQHLVLFLLFLVTSYQLLVTPVSAHVLASDGSIGAVLHIDPDDDPIAGQPSNFYFAFKDQNNKFQPAQCNCTFSVSENGKVLYSNSLTANNANPSLSNISQSFTFPQKDVYQVKVQGAPQTPGAFQSFTLNYDIRVDRDSGTTPALTTSSTKTQTPPSPTILSWLEGHAVFLVGFGLIVIFLVGTFVKRHLIKKQAAQNPPPKPTAPQPFQPPTPAVPEKPQEANNQTQK